MDILPINIITAPLFGNLVVNSGSNIITYDANHTIPSILANDSLFDQMMFENSHVTGLHKLTNIKYEADLTVEGSFTVQGTDITLEITDKNNEINLELKKICEFLNNDDNKDQNKLKLIQLLSKMCDKITSLENEIAELRIDNNFDNINITI